MTWWLFLVMALVAVGVLTALLTGHFALLTISGLAACVALIVLNARWRHS